MSNPKDIYAINDFCFLATYDNITRYSEFMFGNSAPLEHMMLFPEIMDDDDWNIEIHALNYQCLNEFKELAAMFTVV